MKPQLIAIVAAVLLVGCGNTKTPSADFYEAAESDNLEALKRHINDGVDINAAKGRDAETALHRTATTGKFEAAKLLIEKGADVNIGRTKDGDTPLDLALSRIRHPDIPGLLRKHGGSHGYLGHEFAMSILENRKPQVDIGQALNMTVAGVVAHQSAIKDGGLMKIPQYAL